MSDSILRQLKWRENTGIEEFELLGSLRGEPQITLFIIHASREHPGRTDLLGAFVPDADEGNLTYNTIDQAKAAAGLYLSAWMQRRLDDLAKFEAEDCEDIPVPFVLKPQNEPRCRVCGCTDNDCRLCIARTGSPCSWVESDLCSACALNPKLPVIRLLHSNECGSKPDWDFTFTGTLEEVITNCERHYARFTTGRRYLIKAADPARGPIFHWLVWQEKDEARKEPS